MKRILLILLLGFSFLSVRATHIVGGEITYRHISGNTYEVTLTVYRDDFNGNPNAGFDSPAMVYLYDVNGNYVAEYSFFLDDPTGCRSTH